MQMLIYFSKTNYQRLKHCIGNHQVIDQEGESKLDTQQKHILTFQLFIKKEEIG